MFFDQSVFSNLPSHRHRILGLYIVGTRCGGYEFYCRYEDLFIWVGQTKESDFDIILEDGETPPPLCDVCKLQERPTPEKGSLYHDNYCPYFYNGKLFMPKSFDYLSHSIEKKLYRMKMLETIYLLHKKEVFVDDKNKNNVGSFIFKSFYRRPRISIYA